MPRGPVEAAVVVPVDPTGRGVFHVGEGLVGALIEQGGADALGLEQADDSFHEAVEGFPGPPWAINFAMPGGS